jgi:S1-C subfamily serine protease
MKVVPVALILGALLSSNGTALAQSTDDRPPGEQRAWAMLDDVVRISERASGALTGEQGFGFVVGARGEEIYIVTADHVVRDGSGKPYGDVLVTFPDDQGAPLPAALLDLRLPEDHGDLAILRLKHPLESPFTWPTIASTENLSLGTKAWRIGKQQHWIPSAEPGQFYGLQGAIWLGFDGLDTPPGSSGGPVVTASGVIGMVVADGGQSGVPDRVLPIGTIEMQMRQWDLPWNLLSSAMPTPTSPRPVQSPPQQVVRTVIAPQVGSGHEQAAINSAARGFVISYYAHLSEDWPAAKAFLSRVTADPIDFYGQTLSLPAYLKQQSHYWSRWPKRTFFPQPDQLVITCDPTARTCNVSDRVNFDVQNTSAARRSVGSEAGYLKLRQEQDSFLIIEQSNSPTGVTMQSANDPVAANRQSVQEIIAQLGNSENDERYQRLSNAMPQIRKAAPLAAQDVAKLLDGVEEQRLRVHAIKYWFLPLLTQPLSVVDAKLLLLGTQGSDLGELLAQLKPCIKDIASPITRASLLAESTGDDWKERERALLDNSTICPSAYR